MDQLQSTLRILPEVQKALENNQPVVTLETTDLAFALPFPQNVEVHLGMQQQLRAHGAVPATIAVVGGKLCVGLSPQEVESLGKQGPALAKASRRDLPVLVARGQDGATTVAATMILSALVGVRVFVTGGIGGVRYGAPLDISADLEELGRTSTMVVCSGVHSALDVGATMEVLETKGVPVLGFGTDAMPAFYTPRSGFSADVRIDTPAEAARIFAAKESLGLRSGVLVANPVPPAYAIDPALIESAAATARTEAEHSGVRGKDLATFLVGRINQITGGKSQEANSRLLLSNAALAADIAVELSRL